MRFGPTASESLDAADLESWFASHGRDLPWRQVRDPWSIVVAEMMLQQTQVSRVIERWHQFLRRFPTVDDCAAAPVADVIDEWSGLGYNRRAVFLHRMATTVVADHGGAFPRTLADLLALPGIGAYTARAILVFAFEEPAAVLDTNVARILARTSGRTLGRKEAQELADSFVVGQGATADPWSWNQALLDVGAGYCTAKAPKCTAKAPKCTAKAPKCTAKAPGCGPCPFLGVCAWAEAGHPEPDPAIGSAGVSGKQSKFGGSDRQGRGRLVKALRTGAVGDGDLAAVMGWPEDFERAKRVADSLVVDGLAESTGQGYQLPM